MARGWESKSVEQQQAELADRAKSLRPPVSPHEQERIRQRDGLLLSRTYLLRQLEATPHPGRRRLLQEALADIEKQLAYFQ
jgi:hypothetical protein